MKQLQFGEWIVEVDIKATKEYYKNLTITPSDDQCYRNYYEYCKSLSPEEQQFFDSLYITPECCNVRTIGLDKDGQYPTFGCYYAIGRYTNKPEEHILCTADFNTSEEFQEELESWNPPDNQVYIGHFTFDFQDPNSHFADIPEDAPVNSICIQFSASSFPWILKERCKQKQKQFNPPKSPHALERKLKHHLKKSKCKNRRLTKKDLFKIFKNEKIKYKKLSKNKTNTYMLDWFNAFVAADKREEAVSYCFSANANTSFLWHAFGSGVAPCLKGKAASKQYDEQIREKCILLMNYEELAYEIDNAENLRTKEVDEFNDIFITDADFKWTYVHTHDEYFGPYFAYPPED